MSEQQEPLSDAREQWTATMTVTYSPHDVLSACIGCRGVGTWDEIVEHVKTCPDHPIGQANAEVTRLRAALAQREQERDAVTSHPTPIDPDGRCWFCGGGLGHGPTGHTDDCAWVALKRGGD